MIGVYKQQWHGADGRPRGRRAGGRARRPATVLIMVVALLTMLFVAGAAFLGTVSFESRSLQAVQQAEQQSRVVETLALEVRKALRAGYVGDDGKPWNRDSEAGGGPSPIGDDISGEIPGVHPLIASVEPYEDSALSAWFFRYASDLELTFAGTPLSQAVDFGSGAISGRNLVFISPLAPGTGHTDPQLAGFDQSEETAEGTTVLTVGDGTPALYRRDADGDGMWDSYEYELPPERYGPQVLGDLPEQLKAGEETDDALYYALRVVPHGAMVNLNQGHETLVETLFDTLTSWQSLTGEYTPEAEESTLRRRFLLPPQRTPLSGLQARDGQIPDALYNRFVDSGDWADFQAGTLDARWWMIDTGDDGSFVGGEKDLAALWTGWLDPDQATAYDIRHLLTTVSYDDQLMRLGRSLQPAYPDQDWIDDILSDDTAFGADLFLPTNFWVQDWPTADADNPLRGRLKVSLPGLVEAILFPNDPGGFFGTGGTYFQKEFDALADAGLGSLVREQVIRTIQDAFLLMLQNLPSDPLPDGQTKQQAAAMLTANLVDFVDTDDVPTWVEEVTTTGLVATGTYVYGLERQPYITELYAGVEQDLIGTPTAAAFGIELFNPYDDPIDLTGYLLIDNGGAAHDLQAHGVGRLGSTPLDGYEVPPNGFVVFYAGGYDAPTGIPGGVESHALTGSWGLDFNTVLELRRSVPGAVGPVEIVVDRFDVTTDTGSTVFGKDDPGKTHLISLQRDNSQSGGVSNWRFVVPRGSEVSGTHALGDENGWTDPTIKPVHLAFADAGPVTGAFPTTGTLLLLSRYSNNDTDPFNVKLRASADDVNNGRMPVFDDTAHATWSVPEDGDATPDPFDLHVPWGQLIFDYFTALPLSNTYTPSATYDAGDPATWPAYFMPTVDQGGVRVHGRIDLNAAPWAVLAGLPLVPRTALPAAYQTKIQTAIFGSPGADTTPSEAVPVGAELAQSTVAYREARQMTDTGAFQSGVFAGGDRLRHDAIGNAYTGFLTVGELANVRRQTGSVGFELFEIDSGLLSDGDDTNDDFVKAAAVLIALGDWMTTRSHVFTVYGTIRGSGSKSEVDLKALRFQETLDRMPTAFSGALPQRIGRAALGPYWGAQSD